MLRRALVLSAALAAAACSKSAESSGEPRAAEPAKPTETGAAPEKLDIQPIQARQLPPSDGTKAPEVATGAPEKAPAKGGDPAPTKGDTATAGDDSYSLALEQPADVAAGAAATARLIITPGKGYKMNKDFPTKLTLEPPSGVSVDKASMVLADAESFDEHKLVFAVKATPSASGVYTIPGKIKFAVCTDATCDPKRQEVSIRVAAK
jgi:hypothetical protein